MGATLPDLLGSWFIAGIEGASQVRPDGRRLDMVARTDHDRFADADYARLRDVGIGAARESLRWHLVERQPGRYDWSAEERRVDAAAAAGITVVWGLCHFGWPAHVHPFRPDFPDRFAAWAAETARFIGSRQSGPYWFAPQNEISFLAWAGGGVGYLNPFYLDRAAELKRQLARATILAIDAIRAELPSARMLHPEPLIHVVADPLVPYAPRRAAEATEAQFEAWDMLAGRLAPELGGSEAHLDVLGPNYYPYNQWTTEGRRLPLDSPLRVPLSGLLAALHRRYGRPIVIAETGAEDAARAPWLRLVGSEVALARTWGVPVEGICLYPILNHPGWDDDRHCHNGLWDYADARGHRATYRPLADEMRRWIMDPSPNLHPGRGTDRARVGRMGNHGRLQLAIAVILASTRAAVESHRRARESGLVRATAERGLALIDELGARLPDDVPAEISRLHAAARDELVALVGAPE